MRDHGLSTLCVRLHYRKVHSNRNLRKTFQSERHRQQPSFLRPDRFPRLNLHPLFCHIIPLLRPMAYVYFCKSPTVSFNEPVLTKKFKVYPIPPPNTNIHQHPQRLCLLQHPRHNLGHKRRRQSRKTPLSEPETWRQSRCQHPPRRRRPQRPV